MNNGSLITKNKELGKEWVDYFEKFLICKEPDKIFYFNQEIREEQGCGGTNFGGKLQIQLQINILKTINLLGIKIHSNRKKF